jgi:hypothetical protein
MGKLVGPATKSSKSNMVLAAKITIKMMNAVSFFNELNIPTKGLLP